MTIDEIISFVDGLDGVLTLRPGPGDGTPEIAWGDAFFYYSPNGDVPERTQPFATIVTKNYPGDDTSELERPEAFRVNVAAGREAFLHWTGHTPRSSSRERRRPQLLRCADGTSCLRLTGLACGKESGRTNRSTIAGTTADRIPARTVSLRTTSWADIELGPPCKHLSISRDPSLSRRPQPALLRRLAGQTHPPTRPNLP